MWTNLKEVMREEAKDLNNWLTLSVIILPSLICTSGLVTRHLTSYQSTPLGFYSSERGQMPIVAVPDPQTNESTLAIIESNYRTQPDGKIIIDCFSDYIDLNIPVLDLSRRAGGSYSVRIVDSNQNDIPDLELQSFFWGPRFSCNRSVRKYEDIF